MSGDCLRFREDLLSALVESNAKGCLLENDSMGSSMRGDSSIRVVDGPARTAADREAWDDSPGNCEDGSCDIVSVSYELVSLAPSHQKRTCSRDRKIKQVMLNMSSRREVQEELSLDVGRIVEDHRLLGPRGTLRCTDGVSGVAIEGGDLYSIPHTTLFCHKVLSNKAVQEPFYVASRATYTLSSRPDGNAELTESIKQDITVRHPLRLPHHHQDASTPYQLDGPANANRSLRSPKQRQRVELVVHLCSLLLIKRPAQ